MQATQDIEERLIKERNRRGARKDVNKFIEYCMVDSETGHLLQQGSIHRTMHKFIDENQYSLIVFPRYFGKTTQVLGRILDDLGKNANEKIKVISSSDDIARKRVKAERDQIATNTELHAVYPNLYPDEKSDTWSKSQLTVKRQIKDPEPSLEGCGILSTGQGGRATKLYFDDVCFLLGHEVLTEKGFKRFEDLRGDEKVAVMSKESFEVTFEKPERFVRKEYTGRVFSYKGKKLEFNVTEGHDMLVKLHDGFSVMRIEELAQLPTQNVWFKKDFEITGEKPTTLIIPPYERAWKSGRNYKKEKTYTNPGYTISSELLMKIIGFFLAEGCVIYNRFKSGERRPCGISFYQNEGEILSQFEEVLKRADLKFSVHSGHRSKKLRSVSIYDIAIGEFFRQFGSGAKNKFIPLWIKQLDGSLLEHLLTWFVNGDGGHSGGTRCYTASKQLAEDLYELALRSGYAPRMRATESTAFKTYARSGSLLYYISLSKRPLAYFYKKNLVEHQYSGEVFCVTTSGGLIYVRKNGKGAWFGNCSHRNTIKVPKLRGAVKEAFNDVWMNLLGPDGRAVYIATLLHKDDLTHELMRNDKWKKLMFAVGDNYESPWPEKWPPDKLREREKLIKKKAFDRNFRNKALSDEDILFKADMLESSKVYGISNKHEMFKKMQKFVGVDLAISDTGHYTVLFEIGVENNIRYPLRIIRGHYSSPETAKLIKTLNEIDKPIAFCVENNGYQKSLIQWLKAVGVNAPVISYTTGLNKVDLNLGLPSVALEFESDLWKIPMGEEPHEEGCDCLLCVWLSEMEDYPIGKYDDTVMATLFAREAFRQSTGDTASSGYELW